MKKLLASLLLVVLLPSLGIAETLTITFLGDCTIGAEEKYIDYDFAFQQVVGAHGKDWPFSGIIDVTGTDDLTVANCEVTFSTRKRHQDKSYVMRATPEWAECFTLGSVEAVTIANNHILDYYEEGRTDTKAALDAQGILWFGFSYTAIYEVKGVKIGMFSYGYPHKENIATFKKQTKELREQGCDIVVAAMHWGRETNYGLTGDQTAVAKGLIDAGVDVIFGTGPHVLQAIQMYNGVPCLYSLANFTFGADPAPKDPDTAVVQLTYNIDGDKPVLEKLEAIPMRMHNNKDYRPYEYEDEKDRARVFKKLMNIKNCALPADFASTGIAVFGE